MRHYLIGLIAATGMRAPEAVALLESVLTKDGLLIRETKFHKSRPSAGVGPMRRTASALLRGALEVVRNRRRRSACRCERSESASQPR